MYCYRTTEPPVAPPQCTLSAFGSWADTVHDEMTDTPLGDATPPEAIEAWDTQLAYAAGVPLPLRSDPPPETIAHLVAGLKAVGETAEPERVGSAYGLARAGQVEALCAGLLSERENVRRASAYALASLRNEAAVPQLLELCGSAAKSTRKYASFVLGEMAPLTAEVTATLSSLLLTDESAYVRHCAGGALGCAGIRAFATGGLGNLSAAVVAMTQSLHIEVNRTDVAIRQGLVRGASVSILGTRFDGYSVSGVKASSVRRG
jgi:hypothetical protein